MYSCGEKSEILQEVLRIDLTFQDGEFTDLPDNLQAAFTLIQKPLFQKTLKALELHLVNTSAFIEALGSQLPGKEDGDSSSTMTESQSLKSYLMGTSFSKSSTLRFSKIRDLLLEPYPLKSNKIY